MRNFINLTGADPRMWSQVHSLIHLKHREASGLPKNIWEYDPTSGFIVAFFDHDGIAIPVCSMQKPQREHFVIARRAEDIWQIAPARCMKRQYAWETIAKSFDADGKYFSFIILTHAPENVSDELSRL